MYYDSPRGCRSSAFAPYYIVVIVLNAGAIVAGVVSQFHARQRGQGNASYWVDSWYLCNAIFAILHILAAFYIVKKIEEPSIQTANARLDGLPTPSAQRDPAYNPAYAKMTSSPQHSASAQALPMTQHDLANLPTTPPGSYARINHVFMESKVFAVYILVFAAYVVWHKFYDVRTYNPSMIFVMQCADLFIIVGPLSLLLSVLISMNRRREL